MIKIGHPTRRALQYMVNKPEKFSGRATIVLSLFTHRFDMWLPVPVKISFVECCDGTV